MTVSSSVNKVFYVGNGTTTEFAIPFVFFKDTDVVVRVQKGAATKILSQGDDYVLTGTGSAQGGSLSLTVALSVDERLGIVREVPYVQETRYIDGDPLPAELLEQNLDRLTMQTQQLAEEQSRAVTLDLFSTADPAALVEKVEVLYADKDNLDLLADNMSGIKTDAENIDAIKTAASNIGAVQTVSGSIESVKTVSDAVNDVVLCAAEIAAIKDAPNQAAAAGASASAALASQNASAASATASANSAAEAANQAQASASSAASAAASAAAAQVGLATDAEFSAGTAANKAPTVKQAATLAPKSMFQVVSALPASPNANTFYFIPE